MEATKMQLEAMTELKALLKEQLVNNNVYFATEVRQQLAKYGGDDELLLKFLKGRKMNLEKSLNSLIKYAEIRTVKYPEMFPNEVPDFVRHAIKEGIVSVLKHRDRLGRTVMVFRAAKWDVNKISLEEIICVGRYLVHDLMDVYDCLIKGLVLITDCDGATLSQVRQFTVSTIIKFVNVFWQAYPIQIKGVYHVNAPMFVRPVYAIVKPFLPAKLRNRVLITSGMSELYKRIEPEILPESLGGCLEEEEAVSLAFVKWMKIPQEQ